MITVEPARQSYCIGPFAVAPGTKELRFTTVEPPTVARDVIDNGDRRPLSIAVGAWSWNAAANLP